MGQAETRWALEKQLKHKFPDFTKSCLWEEFISLNLEQSVSRCHLPPQHLQGLESWSVDVEVRADAAVADRRGEKDGADLRDDGGGGAERCGAADCGS